MAALEALALWLELAALALVALVLLVALLADVSLGVAEDAAEPVSLLVIVTLLLLLSLLEAGVELVVVI